MLFSCFAGNFTFLAGDISPWLPSTRNWASPRLLAKGTRSVGFAHFPRGGLRLLRRLRVWGSPSVASQPSARRDLFLAGDPRARSLGLGSSTLDLAPGFGVLSVLNPYAAPEGSGDVRVFDPHVTLSHSPGTPVGSSGFFESLFTYHPILCRYPSLLQSPHLHPRLFEPRQEVQGFT